MATQQPSIPHLKKQSYHNLTKEAEKRLHETEGEDGELPSLIDFYLEKLPDGYKEYVNFTAEKASGHYQPPIVAGADLPAHQPPKPPEKFSAITINGKQEYNWRFYDGLKGDNTPIDKIFSFLLLKYPFYLPGLTQQWKDVEAQVPHNPDSPSPAKVFLTRLNEVFLKIQDGLKKELDFVAEALAAELLKDDFGVVADGDRVRAKTSLLQYLRGDLTEEQLLAMPEINPNALYYIQHAKKRYKERQEDIEGSSKDKGTLKILKKAINAFARENGLTPLLTKRKVGNTKTYIIDDEATAQEREIDKEEARKKKQSVSTWSKIHAAIYPFLRSIAAVFGTYTLIGGVAGMPFIPSSLTDILITAAITAITFTTTYYSNRSLALDSAKYLKTGFTNLIYEKNSTRPRWRRYLNTALIIGATLGVMSIYGFPLYMSVNKLAGEFNVHGAGYTALSVIGGAAALWITYEAMQIFLPKVSDWVRKASLKNLWNFLYQEFYAPIKAAKKGQRSSAIAIIVFPNILRALFVLGCVALANYVTFWSTVTNIESVPDVLNLGGDSVFYIIAVTLIVFNTFGCYMFVSSKLHDVSTEVSGSIFKYTCNKLGIEVDNTTALTTRLDDCAKLNQQKLSGSNQSDVAQQRLPLKITSEGYSTAWAFFDFVTRAVGALVSNLGTLGVGSSANGQTVIEGGAAAAVSAFQKVVTTTAVNVDRAGYSESTYAMLGLPKTNYSGTTLTNRKEDKVNIDSPGRGSPHSSNEHTFIGSLGKINKSDQKRSATTSPTSSSGDRTPPPETQETTRLLSPALVNGYGSLDSAQ